MKAKTKAKNTKYVVAYADYNHNEHHDALGLCVLGRVYDTPKAAHDDIMEDIRNTVREWLAAEHDDDETKVSEDEVSDVVESCVWYDSERAVRFEYGEVEYAYAIEKVEL